MQFVESSLTTKPRNETVASMDFCGTDDIVICSPLPDTTEHKVLASLLSLFFQVHACIVSPTKPQENLLQLSGNLLLWNCN